MLEKPTVTIEHPDEPGASMIINKSDYNPEIHKIFEPKTTERETDAGADPTKPKGRKKANEAE